MSRLRANPQDMPLLTGLTGDALRDMAAATREVPLERHPRNPGFPFVRQWDRGGSVVRRAIAVKIYSQFLRIVSPNTD